MREDTRSGASKWRIDMRAKLTLAVVAVLFAATLALGACGGSGKRAVVQPFRAGNSEQSTRAEALDYPESTSLDEALAEIKELECPDNVDAELWVELKGALGEALNCRAAIYGRRDSSRNDDGGDESPPYSDSSADGDGHSMLCPYKFAATPPTGDDNWVNDLTLTDHYDGTYTLSWHYRNLGDYDQNGTVGISDITPLAIHYNEEVPEDDEERNSIQAVVDGSENGIVDIADITPIAMNYGNCCARYSIRGAQSNPESIEDTSEIDTVPIALAEGDGRKLFSVEITEEPRTYITVAPMDADETPGELSNIVLIPNHPPVAQLLAEPTEGDAPLEVTFDASGSSDIDGPIAKYEWDWEGDGVYDHDSGSVPTAERTYDIAQTYDPQVRVTDKHNGTCTASVTVTVGDWHIFVAVDDTFSNYTDIEVVNGHPAICYINPGFSELVYVRATDALGTTWGEPVVVDDGDENKVGPCASLAVVNGRPAIAYYSWEDHKLKYVRANDANGDSWGSPLILTGATVGMYPEFGYGLSLVVVDQKPAITFEGRETEGLVYLRALDANGDSWGSPIQVVYLLLTNSCSMAVVNGRPAISYWDHWDSSLSWIQADDAAGNTWGSPICLEYMPPEGPGKNSLAAINGNPAISYRGPVYENLKYVRALDPDGNAWGTPLIVESEFEGGGWPTLVTVHGCPAISYAVTISTNRYALRYVQAADADGTSWRSPVTVQFPESEDFGGATYMSMAEVNGHPGISYHFTDIAQDIAQLRYAVYY